LDQAYNSLAAQRDACAAYIASQKHEGWVMTGKTYDDGGFSGGSLQRPALQMLLDDMARAEIDIIVVYKIDRLTRSLADFAKLTEVLDRHNVSFVAVTQQFNTSTSMGRLTLNVLLSFAQFEREVAGERIRDKIAASKRRGMWMGGHPPLGYEAKDRKLIVNEGEAETVRHIFRRYLELRSVRLLQQDLAQSNTRSRKITREDGTTGGGLSFSRGALYTILKNPIYRGLIPHKGEVHPGDHDRIIDEPLFREVQTALASAGPGEKAKTKRSSPAILKGLVFDAAGHRLQPTHSARGAWKYRYYVSSPLLRGQSAEGHGIRVPAADLETIVITTLADRLKDKARLKDTLGQACPASALPEVISAGAQLAKNISSQLVEATGLLQDLIARIVVSKAAIRMEIKVKALAVLLLKEKAEDPHHQPPKATQEIIIPGQVLRCGKQIRLVLGQDTNTSAAPNQRLIDEIIRARRWFNALSSGEVSTIAALARRDRCSASYVSLKIGLAFLAPEIVEAILEGTQPDTLTPERLKKACPLPASWDEQRALLLA
jgi:DNA invertase Pin-like site-specific DNA recombinase